ASPAGAIAPGRSRLRFVAHLMLGAVSIPAWIVSGALVVIPPIMGLVLGGAWDNAHKYIEEGNHCA
ncbi:MAG: hypothetical protein P3B76_13615, partial [Gemmatimonadota bacterium]|nr:hypothetical protein [Gemmatimonadota bacterium]MDQ8173712.1 hypothetical protein [Gemmatimonadota bacterium]